jgi:hypothetical protein
MTDSGFSITRRGLLAAVGGAGTIAGLSLFAQPGAAARQGPSLVLQARPGTISLRPGEIGTAVATVQGIGPQPIRFARGDEVVVRFENQLAQPELARPRRRARRRAPDLAPAGGAGRQG